MNVGSLRAQGVELAATVLLERGFAVSGNFSTLKSKNVANPALPIGDTYANKLNLALGWTERHGRLWAEYAVRRNGDQKDIAVGSSPVGNVLPAFTVQSIRGGIRGWMIAGVRQDLTVIVNNLANVLYAETANSSFFRPEPGRMLKVAISSGF